MGSRVTGDKRIFWCGIPAFMPFWINLLGLRSAILPGRRCGSSSLHKAGAPLCSSPGGTFGSELHRCGDHGQSRSRSACQSDYYCCCAAFWHCQRPPAEGLSPAQRPPLQCLQQALPGTVQQVQKSGIIYAGLLMSQGRCNAAARPSQMAPTKSQGSALRHAAKQMPGEAT